MYIHTYIYACLQPFSLTRPPIKQVDDVGVGKYYEIAEEASAKVATDNSSKGILLCGSGMGMAIVANKRPGVRAAVVENKEAAINSRSINATNVLTLGGACVCMGGWIGV